MMAGDPHDLARFVEAQEGVYPSVIAELRAGAKRSHWMWFVFPQIAGLGTSAMTRRYALASADEARTYLGHPLLGPRLRDCSEAVLGHAGRSAEAIFGAVDAVKLRSSMTLFEAAAGGDGPFAPVLEAFFGGERDPLTRRLLA